jgi:hypothetical protein
VGEDSRYKPTEPTARKLLVVPITRLIRWYSMIAYIWMFFSFSHQTNNKWDKRVVLCKIKIQHPGSTPGGSTISFLLSFHP